MLRLSTRLVIKVVLMPTLTDNVRSEALVEAVHSEVVSLETQWSRGMLRTTPPAHAAKVAAVALGTHVRDPQVCKAWRSVSRGSWLPTVDPQHALRCWAVMEAAGVVAEQILALDEWLSKADRDQAQRDIEAILRDLGNVLLRSAQTVVNPISGPAPHTRSDLETQISRVAALHGCLSRVRSGDELAYALGELAESRPVSARSA